jgi:glycine dehydrogenase subunit 2
MIAIRREMETDANALLTAPQTLPVRRLDDVRAAKNLDLVWAERPAEATGAN